MSTYVCICMCQPPNGVQLFVTPWTVAHHAPLLSMAFPRQEYRSGLPFPSAGDLPNLGIKPGSPTLQADSLSSEPSCVAFSEMLYLYPKRTEGERRGWEPGGVHQRNPREAKGKPSWEIFPAHQLL